jgi:predicted DsbA family dithiol-disulfide isomerase
MQVEIWSDVVCPWCYLGKRRFETAVDGFAHRDEVSVIYRSFELDPSAPKDATTPTARMLASKYGLTDQQASDAQKQLVQRAAADGLTFRMDDLHSGNTADAHRLLHLAKARQRQPELVERLHRAYFTEQVPIFDHGELTRLAVEAGLDRGEVINVLATDEYGPAVDADEAQAVALGVTGVPFFVIDRRYAVSGAQPAATISQVLERAWSRSGA